MTIGERIKKAREAKGMTQTELAEIIGVAKSTITGYEKGNREPDAVKINAIAKALGVSGDYILATGYESTLPDPVPAATELYNMYSQLDDHGKLLVDTVLRLEYVRCVSATNVTEDDIRSAIQSSHRSSQGNQQSG